MRTGYGKMRKLLGILMLSLAMVLPSACAAQAASALSAVPEKSVPVRTKSRKEASMKLGSSVLYSYGQLYQGSQTIRNSGCSYCAAASLIGLAKGKKVLPVSLLPLNQKKYSMSFKSMGAVCEKYGVGYVYVRRYGSRSQTLSLMKNCLLQHRPVICFVKGKWSTGSYHLVLLAGITDKGRVLVADSARDRSWSGSMQRFKLVRWNDLTRYICALKSTGRKEMYASTAKMPKSWGCLASPGVQYGFLTTAKAVY